MSRYLILFFFLSLIQPLNAQDTLPVSVFFRARADTDGDGAVTDADNLRLYQVALDGTPLFATPPQDHVLLYTLSPYDEGLSVAVVVQTPANRLAVQVYDDSGLLAHDILLSTTRLVETIHWQDGQQGPVIFWTEQNADKTWQTTTLTLQTGVITHASLPPLSLSGFEADNSEMLIADKRYRMAAHFGNGVVLQWLDAPQPLDALWIYDPSLETPLALNSFLPVEPLLLATDFGQVFLIGRELDGSMSLYQLDFTSGLTTPTITPLLTGLIDPPYLTMQAVAGAETLLFVGVSGDFVVTTIGTPEALYAFDMTTGAMTRLSPEGTFVDRYSILTR